MKEFLIICSSFFPLTVFPQDTVVIKPLDEVVVTATRTEKKLGNVAVPVQTISKKTIQQSGSLRLQDILKETSGIFITNGGGISSAGGGVFGNGVQLQGLSPDYTLILLDGEPVIGRQGGVIDLSRITAGNIRKIEIVKGPSSSLYGSEAMGGVINIITDGASHNNVSTDLRYGRFGETDINLSSSLVKDKWGLQGFGNRNTSSGFDLDKNVVGKTIDPFRNYTAQLKAHLQLAPGTKLNFSGRYFNEVQDNFFPVKDINTASDINISGDGRIRDLNLIPSLHHRFSSKVQTIFRAYFSSYEYEQQLNKEDKSSYYYDFFQQNFYKAESQTNIQFSKQLLSAGLGFIKEMLNTTRYAGRRSNDIQYIFLQDEWKATEKFLVVGGLRFDANSAYQSRLSPKLALQYKYGDRLRLKASYGAGFKAPDFRQLFLNFLNTAAGGYIVYGANEITVGELERGLQNGEISAILPAAYKLALLKPEISKGINVGATYATENFLLDVNLFRNDIQNLIQNDIIAYRNNSAPVYSYFNVKSAFTQGIELNATHSLNTRWSLQGGYQFLMTADKADLQNIKEGSVFTRDDATNEVKKLKRADYAGLPNRSAHLANAKLFYENDLNGWSGSLRTLFIGRWGTYDKEGNGVINRDDEFAQGYLLINLAIGKKIKNLRVQAGADNILNHRDKTNLPGEPGVQPYISLSWSFINKTK